MASSESATDESTPAPWFTHDLQSPPFLTVETKEGYEVRKYKPSKWVGTQTQSNSAKSASSNSFWPLFKFISGKNQTNKKIPMTTPVLVKIPSEATSNNKRDYITHFYLPHEYQQTPNTDLPQPNNPAVTFYDYPEMTVYVLSYGGFTSDSKLSQHSSQLAALLERDGMEWDKSVSFYAGHDPPFRLFNRHNEVWFVAAQLPNAPADSD